MLEMTQAEYYELLEAESLVFSSLLLEMDENDPNRQYVDIICRQLYRKLLGLDG